MTSPRGERPVDLVQRQIGCDEETARTVVRNLGGVLSHDQTRAFIVKAWHLATTTVPTHGTDRDVFIAEGHRQAALFLVACAQTGMDLRTFHSDGDNET